MESLGDSYSSYEIIFLLANIILFSFESEEFLPVSIKTLLLLILLFFFDGSVIFEIWCTIEDVS